MIDLKESREAVESKIIYNLGIDSIKPGGYLNTVLDGLYTATEATYENIKEISDNLFLDSADIRALEKYGSNQGMARINSQDTNFYASNKDLKLNVELYKSTADLELTLFKVGDVLVTDIYEISFYNNIVYRSNLNEIFITAKIAILKDYSFDNLFLNKDEKIYLKIPKQYKDIIRTINLEVMEDRLYSKDVESEVDYRSRLRASINSKNLSNERYVESCIRNTPDVYQFYIDRNQVPFKIYITSSDMYVKDNTKVQSKILPQIKHKLTYTKSYGESYEVLPAIPVEFSLDFTVGNREDLTETMVDNIISNIVDNHRLGNIYGISQDSLESFFYNKRYNINFELQVYIYYNEYQVLNKIPNKLILKENEFPVLKAITINGE